MADPTRRIDKQHARRSFSRAADSYDEVAVLQREVGERMLNRLQLVRMRPETILDLGAGTGVATGRLLQQYGKASVYALDFALPMLQRAKRRGSWLRKPRCACADMEQLPFASNSMELIYSNLAFQWANDLPGLFAECLRVLKPGGLLMFSTFGPDTLKELRLAWETVDNHAHISPFIDMHDIGDLLVQGRYADPVMDVDQLTLTYDSVDEIMRDLKQLGAHNATHGRPRSLTGKGRMAAMRAAYEQFRRDGLLPASYEVVYGHAWVPEHAVALDSLQNRRSD